MRATCDQEPIDTWYRMKDELRGKYVPPSFSACLMYEWHQCTQRNKLAKEYMAKFDLSSDGIPLTVNTEGQAQMFLGLESPLQATCELKC